MGCHLGILCALKNLPSCSLWWFFFLHKQRKCPAPAGASGTSQHIALLKEERSAYSETRNVRMSLMSVFLQFSSVHDKRQLPRSITHPIASESKAVTLHQATSEPRLQLTAAGPLSKPQTDQSERILKRIWETLSRFSSNSSKHSLNAARSSCFSNVPRYTISVVKLTRKLHGGKDFVSRATFYHWQKD